ncbi:NAD-dependent epimerase/dehydratase family protein [Phaeobacter sp. C3_T13_0]|uniref:NAD-dependent epimerase/dehydratase family protein n=1 Tax=Phaeobacter cretensis TaxID=3342641 RepID=UPI0039BCE6C6
MKIALIGSGGFVGQRIVDRLEQRDDVAEVTAIDVVPTKGGPKTTVLQGDFADPNLRDPLLDGADAVIFLAAILGGAAEVDYDLARRVNLDTSMDLIDHLKATAPTTRFAFASTIGVYATPMAPLVDDTTPHGPTMVYGAQKAMMEVALNNFALRGWLDAVSLRPSGIMARDGADARLKSAFMSRLFYCVQRGEDIVLPVGPEDTIWLSSVENVAQNFIHAAILPEVGDTRAFTLPALRLTYGELLAALRRRFPESQANVTFAPDPDTVTLFGSFPELKTQTADRLGFSRDADADALVLASMS